MSPPLCLSLLFCLYLCICACLPLSGDDSILLQPDFTPDWAQPDLPSENRSHTHTLTLTYARVHLKTCVSVAGTPRTSVFHTGVTLPSVRARGSWQQECSRDWNNPWCGEQHPDPALSKRPFWKTVQDAKKRWRRELAGRRRCVAMTTTVPLKWRS